MEKPKEIIQKAILKYPYIPIKTIEDAELVLAAEGYNRVRWVKISHTYYNYLCKQLNISLDDEVTSCSYNFYYKLLEGRISIFPGSSLITIWIWVDPEKEGLGANELLWHDVLSRHSSSTKGLVTAIDPNYGGEWSERTKEEASLIIWG